MSIAASSMRMGASGEGGPKTLRLTSQACYTRVARQVPTALTTTSTYDSTIGSLEHTQAAALCVQARQTTALNNLVSRTASAVPLDSVFGPPAHELAYDAVSGATLAAATGDADAGGGAAAAAAASPARAGAAAVGAGAAATGGVAGSPATLSGSSRFKFKEATRTGVLGPLSSDSPAQTAAFESLCGILDGGERHGICGAMTKEFFGAGSQDGPFPGARSAQGEYMAGTFYAHTRPYAGVLPTDIKPSPYSAVGYKLTK